MVQVHLDTRRTDIENKAKNGKTVVVILCQIYTETSRC